MVPSRITQAQAVLRADGLDALLVGPSADLRYLAGYDAPPLERLTMLVVPAEGEPVLVVPRLEEALAREVGADAVAAVRAYDEADDPIALVVASIRAAGRAGRLAVQDRLWTSFTLGLQAALPGAAWSPGSAVTRRLRRVKDVHELDALRAVAAAIDRVHARVPDVLAVGRTEAEVARELTALIQEEHDRVNFVIVGSGPNGASPHHVAGTRRLADGDAVVVDIGGTRAGYCSDVTRDYVIGSPPDGYEEVHAVLEEAQRAAVAAVRPGVAAGQVDEVARTVIADAGFGAHFIHRTGHGIGLEEHEEPWILAGNPDPLEPGMVFSVEPGIYLPGRFGARIEDIVAVTDDGVESLNQRPRPAVVVD